MKNLIAELLVRLAEKEEASKELVAQIEALEIVVTALVQKLDNEQFQQITQTIMSALGNATEAAPTINPEDSSLLERHIQRLLYRPRQ